MNEHSVVLSTPRTPDEVFAVLRRQERFAETADDLESVEVLAGGEHRYALRFRGGVARWTQRTEVDVDARTLRFEQVEGDFVDFGGTWEVRSTDGGSRVVHRVSFRTGVPHLAGAIDPMIARVLLRAATSVVSRAAGPAEVVEGESALRDEVFSTT
ncbi:type II toxin-antitoxin system RatA family toxin [Saccharothrix sp. Mg75]|uniref:type II toxin-antitoxin system RatA family toxin n=1 Tax=Saccharothrix sp. Mg75 TaxID=3445357 RepID=UPI003EEDDF8B